MYRKKLFTIGMMAAALSMTPVLANAEGEAPESLQFAEEAYVIPGLGETYDAGEALEIAGEGASQEIVYSTYDETVAEVSEEGVVTAVGYGVTTIIASSAADETVSASMDVAVFDLFGTYSGVKTIEAMGCDIAIDITLEEDGTFTYYRAPMVVQLEGGGEMPEQEDAGTYEMSGAEITFTGEALGEYTLSFGIQEEEGYLTGKVPTGGADTEMDLVKAAEEEETEESTEELSEAQE